MFWGFLKFHILELMTIVAIRQLSVTSFFRSVIFDTSYMAVPATSGEKVLVPVWLRKILPSRILLLFFFFFGKNYESVW